MKRAKRTLRLLAVAASMIMAAFPAAFGQDERYALKARQIEEVRPLAEKSLALLPELATDQTYRSLGFLSLNEVEQAALGVPLAVHYYWTTELRRERPGDPEKLLAFEDEVVFPIEVAGTVRSSMVLKKKDDFWRAAAIGSTEELPAFDIRDRQAAAMGITPAQFFLVRVPQLYLLFVGHYNAQGKLMLISAWESEKLGIKSGQSLPAEEVLRILRPGARAYGSGPLSNDPAQPQRRK